ncbi:hypothetical protein VD0002_g8292 [Verticillium dahliae]|uniref:Uncharacterized protein n=1 Tax=Verticillium dahliae TaxID=27337 RepID=A0AA44WK29_VERDA|nr:hypothetical protein BJF96_g3630 [Verticillium dahliae]PNH46411.1 hypothetical protein VD0003_g9014 [Verticillium dahliae]PNH59248.1 hypothetical protein VD0002_g8292 [Verticillium dahliae]
MKRKPLLNKRQKHPQQLVSVTNNAVQAANTGFRSQIRHRNLFEIFQLLADFFAAAPDTKRFEKVGILSIINMNSTWQPDKHVLRPVVVYLDL